MKLLDNFLISKTSTLLDAIKAIEINSSGIVFTTHGSKLVGSLSDGDIRRALISGASLNEPCQSHHNVNVVYMPIGSSDQDIHAVLNDDRKIIPLVDEDLKVLDLANRYRLHNFVIMEPCLNGNELSYVSDCIKSNWISSQGKYVSKFESEVSRLAGGGSCLATSNGTTALHLGLETLGIGRGDEVIVPSFTFGASVNAIIHAGATPVIVDIDKDTWNIDLDRIETAITSKTKAIMAVHIYGNPCDMTAINKIAKARDLFVVEDCAEALGATINGVPVGSFGDVAAFSFFANKVITCGEGGALVLNSPTLVDRGAELRDHGMDKSNRYWHTRVGYNYRMTNMQAAVGLAQTEQLPLFMEKREIIWKTYRSCLEDAGLFEFQQALDGHCPSRWLYTILLGPDVSKSSTLVMSELKNAGIESRPVFYPMSQMPSFKNHAVTHEDNSAINISSRGFSLPSSVSLTESEVEYISSTLINIVNY